MSQKILGFGLGLVLILFAAAVFAQGEEDSITITTYYPSPYGVYNELQSNRMAVGDTDGSNDLNAGDLPPSDGQLYTARSVIYKPQSALPSSNAREGELVYSSSDKGFYYYDGDGWAPQGGGGGGAVLTLIGTVDECVSCPDDWTETLHGYWNCVYKVGGSTYMTGPCFCGQANVYHGGTPGMGGLDYWWASSGFYDGNYFRCRVCVK